MTPLDPSVVREIVRRKLEERLGVTAERRGPSPLRVWSELEVAAGPACETEDMDLSKPSACLIEPHRLCTNSGYCKKLGH